MMSFCSKQKEDHHGQLDENLWFLRKAPGTRKEPIESGRKTWTTKYAISCWLRSTVKKKALPNIKVS